MRLVWDSNGRDGRFVEDDYVARDGETIRTPMYLMDSKPRDRVQLVDTFQLDGASLDQFRPGYRTIGDCAPHSSARDTYVRDLQSAWKMDARKRKPPEPDEPDNDDDQDEQDARQKDARGFARRSPEGSRSGGSNQEKNPHQGPQAQGYDARLDGERRRLDDIRKPSLEARADYVRRLQDDWRRPATLLPSQFPKERTTNAPRRNAGLSTRDGGEPSMDEFYRKRDQALSEAWKSPLGRCDPNRASSIELERMSTTFETRTSPPISSPGDRA
jgi:hypothetical protein